MKDYREPAYSVASVLCIVPVWEPVCSGVFRCVQVCLGSETVYGEVPHVPFPLLVACRGLPYGTSIREYCLTLICTSNTYTSSYSVVHHPYITLIVTVEKGKKREINKNKSNLPNNQCTRRKEKKNPPKTNGRGRYPFSVCLTLSFPFSCRCRGERL